MGQRWKREYPGSLWEGKKQESTVKIKDNGRSKVKLCVGVKE